VFVQYPDEVDRVSRLLMQAIATAPYTLRTSHHPGTPRGKRSMRSLGAPMFLTAVCTARSKNGEDPQLFAANAPSQRIWALLPLG
jgi:hypothetical protein